MSSSRDTDRESAGLAAVAAKDAMTGLGAAGKARGAAGTEAARPSVVVIGAGVSGCACAATLATAGLRVTLMNSAMDRVGLPAYGPDLVGDDGDWSRIREALQGLPSPLRQVWLGAASGPANGGAILNIDRRRVSIETKRALECIPGLDFRQGFVTDLRIVDAGPHELLASAGDGGVAGVAGARLRVQGVEVETIFGEVFNAEAVVVAAGLSLDASTVVGTAQVQGGRYGEPASDGLWAALRALADDFREMTAEVGPRLSVRDAIDAGWLSNGASEGAGEGAYGGEEAYVDASGLATEGLLRVTGPGEPECWPADYPPAPHWDRGLGVDWMVTGTGAGKGEDAHRVVPELSPDGGATAELYVAPGSTFVTRLEGGCGERGGPVATRMPQTVTGKALVGLSESGRMPHEGSPGPVWVVGRAAGARDYAASLISGVRAAAEIAESFGIGVCLGAPGAGSEGCGLAFKSASSGKTSEEKGGGGT